MFISFVKDPKKEWQEWIIRNGVGWNYPDSVFLGVCTEMFVKPKQW